MLTYILLLLLVLHRYEFVPISQSSLICWNISYHLNMVSWENSMAVQCLGLCASTESIPGSISAQGTKVPHAVHWSHKKKKKEKYPQINTVSWDFFLPDRSFQRLCQSTCFRLTTPIAKRSLHSHTACSIFFFSWKNDACTAVVEICLDCYRLRITF